VFFPCRGLILAGKMACTAITRQKSIVTTAAATAAATAAEEVILSRYKRFSLAETGRDLSPHVEGLPTKRVSCV
jgi:hypothetical protein